MQRDGAGPGACCSRQYGSLVCVEESEDLTSQLVGSQGSQPQEVGNAAGVAYKAGGTGQPALRDGTADPEIAVADGTVGDGIGCWRWSRLQDMVWGLLSRLVSK